MKLYSLENSLRESIFREDLFFYNCPQSFLKKSNGIAGVHISDFDQEYTNQFFHGIYDTARDNLGGYSYALGENQPVVKQGGNSIDIGRFIGHFWGWQYRVTHQVFDFDDAFLRNATSRNVRLLRRKLTFREMLLPR